jgi:uncharacterized protein
MRSIGLVLAGVLALAPPLAAQPDTAPIVSIIIDDIGDRLPEGRRAVALPGPVALSFLPFTPHAERLARAAHAQGKEVMLHLPMQAMSGSDLGPGAVHMHMHREEFGRTVRAAVASVPHVVGVNNHMGSLLTRHPGHMSWLMEELVEAEPALFFVDSRTSVYTVAERMAREAGVPALRRHVFLDHNPAPEAVEAELARLLRLARRHGAAVAIGHPYPSTLDVLEARLPGLKAQGVELVPLREMMARDARRTSGASYAQRRAENTRPAN